MDATEIAYIAAGSALAGAAIGVGGAFGIELLRARRLRKMQAAERLLDALTENIGSTTEWVYKASLYLIIPGNHSQASRIHDDAEEQSARARAGIIGLRLLAPPNVLSWIEETYEPSVKEVMSLLDAATNERSDANLKAVQLAVGSFHATVDEARGMLRREVDLLRSKKGAKTES